MGAGASGETTCFCFAGRDRVSSAPPVRVAIVGAGSATAYSLLPMIAKGDMFGSSRRVIIHGLDLKLEKTQESMKALEMELQDGNYPLMQQAILTTNDAIAFEDVDYALMLGAFPRQENREEREIMEKNVTIFRSLGKMLQTKASKDCKVVIVGPPANTNAYIISCYTPELPKENIFALSRLTQNRAAGQIASTAGAPVYDVRNVIVWGRSDVSAKADLSQTVVKGVPLSKVLTKSADKKWMDEDLPKILESRGQEITKARKAAAAVSTARAIVDFVKDLHCGTRSGEYTSAGVWSKGNTYGIDEAMYYSFPVVMRGRGRYKVQPNLNVNAKVKKSMKEAEDALRAEKDLAREVIKRLSGANV